MAVCLSVCYTLDYESLSIEDRKRTVKKLADFDYIIEI